MAGLLALFLFTAAGALAPREQRHLSAQILVAEAQRAVPVPQPQHVPVPVPVLVPASVPVPVPASGSFLLPVSGSACGSPLFSVDRPLLL